jgi:chorismate-pyruvate lyase
MSNMILLTHAYVTVMRNVSERSVVLHAHLNPFVHARTMSPEDTIRDYLILECRSDMISGLIYCII